jgi:dephospho-CoA kinase
MADWSISVVFLAAGTSLAVLATYLACKSQIDRTQDRLVALEREMAVARLREDANQRKLTKIFDAVVDLRETTRAELGQLQEKLDRLLTENFPQRDRSAA